MAKAIEAVTYEALDGSWLAIGERGFCPFCNTAMEEEPMTNPDGTGQIMYVCPQCPQNMKIAE